MFRAYTHQFIPHKLFSFVSIYLGQFLFAIAYIGNIVSFSYPISEPQPADSCYGCIYGDLFLLLFATINHQSKSFFTKLSVNYCDFMHRKKIVVYPYTSCIQLEFKFKYKTVFIFVNVQSNLH